jgi:hypothetical protein
MSYLGAIQHSTRRIRNPTKEYKKRSSAYMFMEPNSFFNKFVVRRTTSVSRWKERDAARYLEEHARIRGRFDFPTGYLRRNEHNMGEFQQG